MTINIHSFDTSLETASLTHQNIKEIMVVVEEISYLTVEYARENIADEVRRHEAAAMAQEALKVLSAASIKMSEAENVMNE